MGDVADCRSLLVARLVVYMTAACALVSDALFWAGLEPRGGDTAGPVLGGRPHAGHPGVGPSLRHVPAEDPGGPHQVRSWVLVGL